jgi:hypothetical protein
VRLVVVVVVLKVLPVREAVLGGAQKDVQKGVLRVELMLAHMAGALSAAQKGVLKAGLKATALMDDQKGARKVELVAVGVVPLGPRASQVALVSLVLFAKANVISGEGGDFCSALS